MFKLELIYILFFFNLQETLQRFLLVLVPSPKTLELDVTC